MKPIKYSPVRDHVDLLVSGSIFFFWKLLEAVALEQVFLMSIQGGETVHTGEWEW